MCRPNWCNTTALPWLSPISAEELIADLKQRTGLNVTKVDVGGIDFLHDMAILKIYYETVPADTSNVINDQLKYLTKNGQK